MNEILALVSAPAPATLAWAPGFSDAGRVVAATADLEAVLGGEVHDRLGAAFDEFVGARAETVAGALRDRHRHALGDFPYHLPIRRVDLDSDDPVLREGLMRYVRTRLEEWQGTNLAKLIAVTGEKEGP